MIEWTKEAYQVCTGILNSSYQSIAGPRNDFFVRNPEWNRNCDASCTANNDSSSACGVWKDGKIEKQNKL